MRGICFHLMLVILCRQIGKTLADVNIKNIEYRRQVMAFMRRYIAAFFAVLLASTLAMPCICKKLPPLDQDIIRSDKIFLGQVIGLTPDMKHIEFLIFKSWKGTNSTRDTIRFEGIAPESCVQSLILGEVYLVFSFYNKISICSRTGPAKYSANRALMKELGNPIYINPEISWRDEER
jgi:hypothetical protein